MTFDSGGTSTPSSMIMRYQATNQNLRTDFLEMPAGPAGGAAEGMYMVMNDADSTMMNVMPLQRMAMIMSPNAMPGGQTMPGFKMKARSTTGSYEDLGDGGVLLGHATHHYRATSKGTLDITMGGKTCSRPMESVTEMWVAPDVDIQPAMRMALGRYSNVVDVSGVTDDASPMAKAVKAGTPLKTISRTTERDATGKPTVVTMTMEYTEFERAQIDPAVFRAPAGFQIMDMRAMMADLPAGMMDSVMSAMSDTQTKAMCGSR